MKVPFSLFDIFGFLIPGFILILSIENTLGQNWTSQLQGLDIFISIKWICIAYICGQIIDNFSIYFYERNIVGKVLKYPSYNLLVLDNTNLEFVQLKKILFPSYFDTLPELILNKFKSRVEEQNKKIHDQKIQKNKTTSFHPVQEINLQESPQKTLPQLEVNNYKPDDFVKLFTIFNDASWSDGAKERLAIFFVYYNFARNVSFSCLIAGFLVFLKLIFLYSTTISINWRDIFWIFANSFIAAGMFNRYLRFLRLWYFEICTAYVKAEHRNMGFN